MDIYLYINMVIAKIKYNMYYMYNAKHNIFNYFLSNNKLQNLNLHKMFQIHFIVYILN